MKYAIKIMSTISRRTISMFNLSKKKENNDLMKMREKWLNVSIYLNPQFLTCRFQMADLPLVQT